MKKIKLTQEQADAIEHFLAKEGRGVDSLLELHAFALNVTGKWLSPEHSSLSGLSQSDLARALLIGYEVERQYKVGDWVVNTVTDTLAQVTNAFQQENDVVYVRHENFTFFCKAQCRHATPEEIKQEKERRLWKSIDREVGEFKEGDVYMTKHYRDSFVVECDDSLRVLKERHEYETIKGFYPAESFISFEEGGEE